MTGRDLLNELRSMTEAELELNVHCYVQTGEDGDMPSRVRIRGVDESPYYKGDNPWFLGDAEQDEKLIFIE